MLVLDGKRIIRMTIEGIAYLDEDAFEQFIYFSDCHQNNLLSVESSMGSKFTDEERVFYQRAKYIGVRYGLSDPPSITFYTKPPTNFEFSSREELGEVLVRIKKAGWRTNDGE